MAAYLTTAEVHDEFERRKIGYTWEQYRIDRDKFKIYEAKDFHSLSKEHLLDFKAIEKLLDWYIASYNRQLFGEARAIFEKGYTENDLNKDVEFLNSFRGQDLLNLDYDRKYEHDSARSRVNLYNTITEEERREKAKEIERQQAAEKAAKKKVEEDRKRLEKEKAEKAKAKLILRKNKAIDAYNKKQGAKNDLYRKHLKYFLSTIEDDNQFSDFKNNLNDVDCTNPEFVRGFVSAINSVLNCNVGEHWIFYHYKDRVKS